MQIQTIYIYIEREREIMISAIPVVCQLGVEPLNNQSINKDLFKFGQFRMVAVKY